MCADPFLVDERGTGLVGLCRGTHDGEGVLVVAAEHVVHVIVGGYASGLVLVLELFFELFLGGGPGVSEEPVVGGGVARGAGLCLAVEAGDRHEAGAVRVVEGAADLGGGVVVVVAARRFPWGCELLLDVGEHEVLEVHGVVGARGPVFGAGGVYLGPGAGVHGCGDRDPRVVGAAVHDVAEGADRHFAGEAGLVEGGVGEGFGCCGCVHAVGECVGFALGEVCVGGGEVEQR